MRAVDNGYESRDVNATGTPTATARYENATIFWIDDWRAFLKTKTYGAKKFC